MTTLQELERQARATVDAVANRPEGRLELRQAFYEKYGFADRIDDIDAYGYGTSELAFLRWEVERGVLDPVGRVRGGSPWWRGVNADFLYFSELGGLVHEAGLPTEDLVPAAAAWTAYIDEPNERSWYTAHNTSIVHGYDLRKREAQAERRFEQIFVNEVLYRLLYAQGLVQGVEMGAIGKLLAHPALPSVDVLVHLPDFYPRDYPLTRQGIRAVLHEGHSLQEWATKLMDEVLISPHLSALYEHAVLWLKFPGIMLYLRDGEPVYPSSRPSSIPRHSCVRVFRWLARLFRSATHA